jgi:hypothetical protein
VGATLVMVNDQDAGRGSLRILSMSTDGLPERTAVLVFEVLDRGYLRGLRYQLESMVTKGVREVAPGAITVSAEVATAGDLALPATPRRMRLHDWNAHLYPDALVRDAAVMATPGQYLLNLRYGDATLSGGNVNVLDASYVANVAVGNNQIIVGTDAPSRDAVVAGNVRPANNPGLGEASDAVAPGIEASGARIINVFDALAIATEAVGTPQDIVNEFVPGRGPITSDTAFVSAGAIASSTTWVNDSLYVLQGVVSVTGGATLTIEAGTRIEGRNDSLAALFILRDGYIIANGTALQPIVMSCVAPAGGGFRNQGCWGGLSIAGNSIVNGHQASLPLSPAVKNSAGGCSQREGEGASLLYGGCDPADSSGVLRYVRSEYAGFQRAPNDELNGINLLGVGNKTVIDHIQVHSGQDDGVEFFGGTVNLKYVYVTANSDDGFDYTFGWNGKVQYLIVQQDSLDGDKAFEVDNGEGDVPFTATPRTNPTIWNVTLVGQRDSANGGGNSVNDAMNLRRGMASQLRNMLVLSFPAALDIDDAPTCVDLNLATGLSIQNSVFARIHNLGNDDSDPNPCGPYASATEAEEAFLLDPANSNSVQTIDSLMVSPYSVMLPDFRLNSALVGATPPADGFFTTSATHVGAVEAKNATGSNIPWYAGWTRGWQSPTVP